MTQPEMEGQPQPHRGGPTVASSISTSIGFSNPGTTVTMVVNIPSDGASITVYGDSGDAASTNLNSGPVSRPANGQISTSGTYDRDDSDYTIKVTMTEGVRSMTFQKKLTDVSPGDSNSNLSLPAVNP